MDRTLTSAEHDLAVINAPLAAKRKARRRRHVAVAMRSVLALAVVAVGWVALNRFDQDISSCVANWVLHPRTDCWMQLYYGY